MTLVKKHFMLSGETRNFSFLCMSSVTSQLHYIVPRASRLCRNNFHQTTFLICVKICLNTAKFQFKTFFSHLCGAVFVLTAGGATNNAIKNFNGPGFFRWFFLQMNRKLAFMKDEKLKSSPPESKESFWRNSIIFPAPACGELSTLKVRRMQC